MAIADTIESIKENLSNAYDMAEEKGATIPTNKNLENLSNTIASIEGGGGAGFKIVVAELPNVTFTLSLAGTTVETKSTGVTGGIVEFTVSQTGTYTITAKDSNNVQLWTTTAVVDGKLAEINVPTTKALNNYTWAEIHTACDNGYAHVMIGIGSAKTYTQTGSLFNNTKLFVEDVVRIGSKDYIDWRFANGTSSQYKFNEKVYGVTSNTSSSWSNNNSNHGGFMHSTLRKKMMKTGDEVYSQASGILPDNYSGTLTDGVKLSDLLYTNQGGVKCKLYNKEVGEKTFVETTNAIYSSSSSISSACKFIKGYFTNVGQISETTFNAGYYYTKDSTNEIYKRATTYVAGTSYYGLYETIQANGEFVVAFSDISSYLVTRAVKSASGGNQSYDLDEFADYVNIPCFEEIMGINKETSFISGVSASILQVFNASGEGSKKEIYNDLAYSFQQSCLTRSPATNGDTNAVAIIDGVRMSSSAVSTARNLRLGFRTC